MRIWTMHELKRPAPAPQVRAEGHAQAHGHRHQGAQPSGSRLLPLVPAPAPGPPPAPAPHTTCGPNSQLPLTAEHRWHRTAPESVGHAARVAPLRVDRVGLRRGAGACCRSRRPHPSPRRRPRKCFTTWCAVALLDAEPFCWHATYGQSHLLVSEHKGISVRKGALVLSVCGQADKPADIRILATSFCRL